MRCEQVDRSGREMTDWTDEYRTLIARLENDTTTPNWANFIEPLDDAAERLSRAWSQVSPTN